MLVYSVEVDEAEEKNDNDGAARGTVPQYEKNIQEILSSIPLAAEVEEARNSDKAVSRSTWIAIKLVREPIVNPFISTYNYRLLLYLPQLVFRTLPLLSSTIRLSPTLHLEQSSYTRHLLRCP